MIYCIDKSNGKLYFAVELLSFLNDSKKDVCLILNDKSNYGEFVKHFPKISIVQNYHSKAGDIIIEISDQVHPPDFSENAEAILYPVGVNKIDYHLPILCAFKRRVYCTPYIIPQIPGKLAKADLNIFIELLEKLESPQDFAGIKILISAGPTVEDIDPVRFMSNRSSGKMGIALAKAAFLRGAEVTLICGPTSIPLPPYLNDIKVRSAREMADMVLERFPQNDVYMGAAAVADYTPDVVADQKIKKEDGGLNIIFKRTTDILKSAAKKRTRQVMVGFSLETENIIKNSGKKLINKNLDIIVINNPKTPGAAFGEDTNVVTILEKNNIVENLPKMTKFEVANKILNKIKPLVRVSKI